jgi:hypothetical protein
MQSSARKPRISGLLPATFICMLALQGLIWNWTSMRLMSVAEKQTCATVSSCIPEQNADPSQELLIKQVCSFVSYGERLYL